jgi:hypothetical protein
VRSPLARGAIALAAVAAVVILFVVLAGGDDDEKDTTTAATTTQARTTPQAATGEQGATGGGGEPTAPQVERIVVRDGRPSGGVKRLELESGERARFVVQSDVADEVHVHGYDVSRDVPAGGSVRFNFPADIEGVFEVELEQRGQQIAELRVSP